VLFALRRNASVHHLYLQLSSSLVAPAVRQEMARRHIYDGVVLSDYASVKHGDALLKEFRYYRPGLRCGTLGVAATVGCQSFRVVSVEAGVRAIEPVKSGSNDPPTYYLVGSADTASSKQVLGTLRALQAAGARHLGLTNSVLWNDPSTLRDTAVELARHVPPGPGG
jgi:hypothetical protein